MQQIKKHIKILGTMPALAWVLLPLTLYLAVTWDASQSPNGTQMFLGAANNFYLLVLTLLFPVALYTLVKSLKTDVSFVVMAILFLAWSMTSVILSQNQHFLTIILWMMTLSILGADRIAP